MRVLGDHFVTSNGEPGILSVEERLRIEAVLRESLERARHERELELIHSPHRVEQSNDQ